MSLRPKITTAKKLSTPAVKHLTCFNIAIGILRARKFKDVVAKAVNITDDKKQLNRMRKTLAKVENEIDKICSLSDAIFSQLNYDDLARIKNSHRASTIALIPETTTNPETLALNILYLEFNDLPDEKLDERLKILTKIDYMDLIEIISEEIGLQKDVSEDMYLLATEIIEDVKG